MKKKKVIEFKGTVATFSTLTVSLRSNSLDELKTDLHELCGDTPDFFNEDLAVLDAAALPGQGAELDWVGLLTLLRAARLNPVAVRHAAAEAEARIRAAGLNLAEEIEVAPRKVAAEAAPPAAEKAKPDTVPPVAETKPGAAIQSTTEGKSDTAVQPTTESKPGAAPAPQLELALPAAPPATTEAAKPTAPADAPAVPPIVLTAPAAAAVVVDRPLRSGQQVYARNADLVVLAMVNPGAEVMADGNIHVYAPLRGRAMAGASGNPNARILTTCFEAELVSIGGVYRPLEPGMPKEVSGKPAQVRLGDNAAGKQTLLIEALKIV